MGKLEINAIIAPRDAGKSSFLYQKFVRYNEESVPILVVDSATDHPEKSLLRMVQASCPSVYIPSPAQEDIKPVDSINTSDCYYPLPIMEECTATDCSTVFLADSAYYLEYGYCTDDQAIREARRKLYREFSMQVAYAFTALSHPGGRFLMIFDEIELEDTFGCVVEQARRQSGEIWLSLHEVSGLGNNLSLIDRLYTLSNYELVSYG